MKRFFAEHSYALPALAKKAGLTPEQFILKLRTDASLAARLADAVGCNVLNAEFDVLQGHGTHFFIETEDLARFLTESVHHWNAALLEAFAESAEEVSLVDGNPSPSSRGRTRARAFHGIIHTCGQEPLAILFAVVFPSAAREHLIITSLRNSWGCYRPSDILESCTSEDSRQAMNLLFGLCLYLACFPDAAKPGFPECAKHPAHYRGERCALVRAVPEVIHHNGPTPHFRRGHFRTLRSECFRKKRWQVIFVSETFVKGTAVTVEAVA